MTTEREPRESSFHLSPGYLWCAGRRTPCAPLQVISAALFWKFIFTFKATIRARPTSKTKRKRIKSFLALCAAPSVWDQGAVLDQCFPCGAYCERHALRFIIFSWVCFTRLARNTVNGCPVSYWCTTWHRNLWSWFARKVSSDTADLYETMIKKHIPIVKSIAVIVFKVGTRWPKSYLSRESLNRIHLSMLWNCYNPAECN